MNLCTEMKVAVVTSLFAKWDMNIQ
jgi:hypothetical protein